MAMLDALLNGLVDYAGLFPPAGLPMPEAVRNHASYLRGPHHRLLGRFILPLARLAEFEAAYSTLHATEQEGWRLSVLASPEPATGWRAIQAFHARWPHARIVSIEAKAGTPADIAALSAAFPPAVELWIEAPLAGDFTPWVAAIKTAGRGAKLRTGGVVPEAFPTATDVIRFLKTCHDSGLTAKATAGLHHPVSGDYRLTYEPASPSGPMFGFLNLFLAAALVQAGGSAADGARLLMDRSAGSFRLANGSLSWRGRAFTPAALAGTRRSLLRSFGSCSFTEPVEGLQGLGWL